MRVKQHVDANIAGHEDQCAGAGFAEATSDIVTTQCLPSITADAPIPNLCLVEDDIDDITEFPIFTSRPSRRLRRTSIEIYRKSLHNAENTEDEEQCDSLSIAEIMENETTATHIEMNSVSDNVSSDEVALLPTESSHSMTLPTTAEENVAVQSSDQTAELPSSTNSKRTAKPKTGILCSCDYDFFYNSSHRAVVFLLLNSFFN